jgi:hypothetical protein
MEGLESLLFEEQIDGDCPSILIDMLDFLEQERCQDTQHVLQYKCLIKVSSLTFKIFESMNLATSWGL